MTFRGTFRNGKVDLDDSSGFVEGERVEIRRTHSESLLDIFLRHTVRDESLPKDLASEVDHYLYGHPKQGSKRAVKGTRSRTSKKAKPTRRTRKARR
jgi:hypothetical protein